MSKRTQLMLMTLGLVVAVFSSAPAAAECEGLRATFEKWVAAYANRDLAGTMSIFADDLNFSLQGAADAKKNDLEKSYREEFSKPVQAKWVPKFEEFDCSGDLGFVRSTWRLEVKGVDRKIDIKAENRSVDILRRTANGEWKIFRSLNYPVVAPKK